MHLVQNRINPLKSDHFVRGVSQKGEIMKNNSERPVDALAEKHPLLSY